MCFFGLFYLEKMIKFAELLRTDMIKGAALATPFYLLSVYFFSHINTVFCPYINLYVMSGIIFVTSRSLEAYRRISVEPSLPSCTA